MANWTWARQMDARSATQGGKQGSRSGGWLRSGQVLASTVLMLGCLVGPALAKDPFRTSNARPIGEKTEAAFRAIFEKGDYSSKTIELLNQAATKEGSDPLIYALRAAIAFNQGQVNDFSTNATMTRQTAEKLMASDALRGNLYVAVGNFLEAAYTVNAQGIVRGMPEALGKVQEAFKKLDEAEKIAANDPELNLIKGVMDLMLSVNVNLPLSNPDQAIARLEQKASPKYIADRSLAWGYRDLKQLDKAMSAVDRALAATPDNPEVQYLKAQITYKQGKYADSIKLFDKALEKANQLPEGIKRQIERERRLANNRLQAQTPGQK